MRFFTWVIATASSTVAYDAAEMCLTEGIYFILLLLMYTNWMMPPHFHPRFLCCVPMHVDGCDVGDKFMP